MEELEIGGRAEAIQTFLLFGQNTEKYLEDLKRLAVTQIAVKDHQLAWVWKLA